MANFAKITATSAGISNIDSTFVLRFVNTSRAISVDLTWTCKAVRTIAYQYNQGSGTNDQGIQALSAVASDIANNSTLSSYLNVSTASNAFQIEANEYGWTITEQTGAGTTNLSFVDTIEVLPAKNFELTGYTISNGTIPCSQVLVTITENDGVSPYSWITPTSASTTLSADAARIATDQSITVTLEDADTDQASLLEVFIPRLLSSAEISSISTVTNTGGLDATVTVFMATSGSEFGGYEYSLDGSNFQSSNVFPNVLGGSYTLYVREGLGCIVSSPFIVDLVASVQRADPFAVVPKANPIRMLQSGINKYQTLENTLYHFENRTGEYRPFYAMPYQHSDGTILTQFHTNYDELSARLLDCDGNIIKTLTISKKTSNQGNQDKRDAIAYNRGNNQTGIYFTDGNIYDPGTTDIIDSYELNGQIPEWGVVGNTVILSGSLAGSYLIKQVIFDSSVQAIALIIDLIWTSSSDSESVITECTYDRLEYETYEFDLDLGDSPLLTGTYITQLLLEDSLSEWASIIFDSELINIQATKLRTNVIEYYDGAKSGIDYSTGYKGLIRLFSNDPYTNPDPGGELENYTDDNAELTLLNGNAALEGTMFIQAVPRYMAEKLGLIAIHEEIYINGEKWSVTEKQDTQNFDHSALRNVTLSLRRNDYEEYNTDNVIIDETFGTIDHETGPILQ